MLLENSRSFSHPEIPELISSILSDKIWTPTNSSWCRGRLGTLHGRFQMLELLPLAFVCRYGGETNYGQNRLSILPWCLLGRREHPQTRALLVREHFASWCCWPLHLFSFSTNSRWWLGLYPADEPCKEIMIQALQKVLFLLFLKVSSPVESLFWGILISSYVRWIFFFIIWESEHVLWINFQISISLIVSLVLESISIL